MDSSVMDMDSSVMEFAMQDVAMQPAFIVARCAGSKAQFLIRFRRTAGLWVRERHRHCGAPLAAAMPCTSRASSKWTGIIPLPALQGEELPPVQWLPQGQSLQPAR
jgi:hypothetical protein